jgi:hypothetical protein
MKKRFWILFLTAFVVSNGLYSQNDSKKGKIVLKYAPLSILDPNLTTLQFGLDYYLNDKNSIQIEYGQKIPFSNSVQLRSSFKGGDGFRIKLESHYYFASNTYNRQYLGIETFYWKNKYYSTDAFLDTILHQDKDFEYLVNKKAYGLGLKYGFIINVSKRLELELYAGIGLKYFDISNFDRNLNRQNCIQYIKTYEWIGPRSFPDLEEYSGIRFNMPMGFRICYNIK